MSKEIDALSTKDWDKLRRTFMREEDVRIALQLEIERSGVGITKWARSKGLNVNTVSDFMCNRRRASPALRKYLGLEMVIGYRPTMHKTQKGERFYPA